MSAWSYAVSLSGPGRQDDDAGRVDAGRGRGLQRLAHGVEEAPQPGQVGAAVQRGQDPGDDAPVGHGVCRAGRRLGTVSEQPPGAGVVPREVGGGQDELARAGQADRRRLVQEAGVAEEGLWGQQPASDQLTLAVEVAEHRVEQDGPLGQAGLEPVPLGRGQQDRDGVQGPPAGGAAGIAQAVRNALVGDEGPHPVRPSGEPGWPGEAQRVGDPGVDRADAVGRDQLVDAVAGQGAILLDDVAGAPARVDRHVGHPMSGVAGRAALRACGRGRRSPASRPAGIPAEKAEWGADHSPKTAISALAGGPSGKPGPFSGCVIPPEGE